MADDELRRLERSTDPADVARLAHALARAGRGAEAMDAAIRALPTAPDDDDLRVLLAPAWSEVDLRHDVTYWDYSVPWRGLRTLGRVRTMYLPELGPVGSAGPSWMLDAGGGVVLVTHGGGLAAMDLVRSRVSWTTPERLRAHFATVDGVVVEDDANEVHVLDPRTGARRAYAGQVDSLADVARIDDVLYVATRGTTLWLFDPRTGARLAEVDLEAAPTNLVTDPTGFVLQLGDTTCSYDRTGTPRWRNDGGTHPIGSRDGRVYLSGVGETLVVSAESGEVVRALDVFSLDPLLVTRSAVIVAGVELWAFDRITLERLWSVEVEPYLQFASTADAILELGGQQLRSLAAEDGAELARLDLGARPRSRTMLLCAGKLVFAAAHRAGLIVVE